MLFNSIQFLVFFVLITVVYYSIAHRFRWLLLLAGSYYFYMCWKAEYIFLIIISTLIDYFAALMMHKTSEKHVRRIYLLISLTSNLSLLFLFKYFNFFNDSARQIFDYFNVFYNIPEFKLLLPVGISFYTFQTLSYTIDVYRKQKEPERNLGIFALYVSFFPQLVAGPIERSTRLLPQFHSPKYFDFSNLVNGLKLMLWGFFLKLVIADQISVIVENVYGEYYKYKGAELSAATFFFGIQIFCDFCGYSTIAIGAALILGFKLMKNFDSPYFSKNIVEFWRRWHISLSSWFKDYLYIPLGGSRVSKMRWRFNIFITFLISGLWHGANWTFVVWGMIHGIAIIICNSWMNLKKRLFFLDNNSFPVKLIAILITFCFVNITWIYFRAGSISAANSILISICTPEKKYFNGFIKLITQGEAVIFWFALAVMILYELRGSFTGNIKIKKPGFYNYCSIFFYSFCFWSIIFFGAYGKKAFIYFQF